MHKLPAALLYGSAATVFAASGHALAALTASPEHRISLPGLALAWLLAVTIASVLGRRRSSPLGASAVLGLGQLAFHGIFAATAGMSTGLPGSLSSEAASPAEQHAAHLAGQGAPLAAGPASAAASADAASAHMASLVSGPMLGLHALAWAASVVVVVRGRAAAQSAAHALPRLAAAASTAVSGIQAPLFTRFLVQDAPAAQLAAVRAALRAHLAHVAERVRDLRESRAVAAWGLRGPPLV